MLILKSTMQLSSEYFILADHGFLWIKRTVLQDHRSGVHGSANAIFPSSVFRLIKNSTFVHFYCLKFVLKIAKQRNKNQRTKITFFFS